MTKMQGASWREITEIYYYKQSVIMDIRGQSHYWTITGFIKIIYRIFQKFPRPGRTGPLRHHTRALLHSRRRKCGVNPDRGGRDCAPSSRWGWSQKIARAGGRFGCLWRRFKEGRAPMRSEPLWLKLAGRITRPPVYCRPVRRARRRRRRPADPWRRPWCRPAQRPPGRRRSARRGSRFPSSSPRSPPTRRLPRPPRPH